MCYVYRFRKKKREHYRSKIVKKLENENNELPFIVIIMEYIIN